jgi:phosphoglycolate phosphatase
VDAYRYFVGEGMEMLVRRALPGDRRDEGSVSRCLGEMRAEYGERWARKTRPYPGIPELLTALVSRGLTAAIVSNKPQEDTLAVVSHLLGSWTFAAVVGARPGLPRKPDPSGALEISRTLGIPPDLWLYLGDTATDMQTANAAGMFAAGALWGFRDADELSAAGAKVLLRHPLELLEHVR